MDCFMYILVVLAYNAISGVCIRTEDPRKYRNSDLPTSRQNLQVRMKELLNLAMIRADILRRLGITDPPLRPTSSPLHVSTESPQKSHGIPFMPLGITRILSESPDTRADTNIIQFKLSDITSDNRTVVDIVHLLVRVKYKKKRKLERLETLPNEGNKDSLTKKSKRERRRKQFLQIELTVSNVTVDGKQGTVLTSVKSRIRKTTSLQFTLHPSILESALNSDDRTLKLHIDCNGCGSQASLILLHKLKKLKPTKRTGAARLLPKRRPVLFIQSRNNVYF